ncbi:MAG: dTMP kinase [Thermodesulfovibrionales bacterium]
MKGAFISFEGIEGTGKSTQCRLLAQHLRQKGLAVTETAEPGGTQISLKIREILLSIDSREMRPVTELLLYNAARVQHLEEVILPALRRGDIVITDRFSDSTFAYQGYGRDLDLELIASLDRIATNGLRPALTILLDIDVETGLRRNRAIGKTDRLELEEISFHEKVRRGFINLAAKESDRITLVDCSGSIGEVHQKTAGIVTDFLETDRI